MFSAYIKHKRRSLKMKNELLSPDILTSQLELRYQELKRCLEVKLKNQKESPQGKLRISLSGGQRLPQYYHIMDAKDFNGSYIPHSQMQKIKQLAQKDYDSKLIKLLQIHIKAFEKILSSTAAKIEQLYSTLSPTRQSLIIPVTLTDTQYIKEWQKVSWTGRAFSEGTPQYITALNERVRSKSEVIIADTLSRMNIPYKYEVPLKLKNGQIFYPDFLCLNLRIRQEFLWEHFGMMDSPEYLEKAIGKMKLYNENGYYLGKNLIITMETQTTPLNMAQLQQLINEYLK